MENRQLNSISGIIAITAFISLITEKKEPEFLLILIILFTILLILNKLHDGNNHRDEHG